MEWLKQLIENALKGKLKDDAKVDIDKLVEDAKKDLGKEFVPKSDFNSKNDELKSTKAKMDELQKQVDDLSKAGGDATKIKEQLDKVSQEFETYKKDTEKREVNRKKQAAIELGLRSAKASDDAIDLLTSQFDLDKITLDNKGNIVDWEDHLKPVKELRKSLFAEVKTDSGGKPITVKPTGGKAAKAQLIEQYNEAEKNKDIVAMMNLQHQIKQMNEE
ncbi:MAG: phage scaffolding protein [Dehalococcoidales bacterium]|nr:phage scaffolding protein [Dehalococcoidales bacterium]